MVGGHGMSSNIVYFPQNHCQRIAPQPEIPEIDIDKLEDIDFAAMYSPPEDYISHDKCYKCGHVFTEDDYVWRIESNPGYKSKLDGSQVSIKICDDCVIEILQNKQKSQRINSPVK